MRKPLRWRIVTALLLAAMLPLALASFGSWVVFGRLLEDRALAQMQTVVESHAQAIEGYLSERVNLLSLLAKSHSLREISDPERLQSLLADLNESTGVEFIDLGVIDTSGSHLAYAGPYDLMDRNYREADWFRALATRDVYISDVFLGYRLVPHCIIAVKAVQNSRQWILRATINSDQFDAIVGTAGLGENSDAYIVSREGEYQTTSKVGTAVSRTPVSVAAIHEGVQNRRVTVNDTVKIEVTTWINDDRWMLVVHQDLASVQAPVDQAIAQGSYVVLVAVVLLVATTFIATSHLTGRIEKADAQREEMSRAFMRSAKLASIGELATGLAHEINNPLAILSAEQTNISDLLIDLRSSDQWREQALDSVERCQTQVRRCASITQKMLQFGRKRESTLESTDLTPRLTEIIDLLQRHANVRNVKMTMQIEENLPSVLVDPVEFEQVLVNLINNSLDALPKGGAIWIEARREGDQVHLLVRDNGIGIKSEHLDRVFEPFYTTKPTGKGTGLGLSVCYGIVHSWGGKIKVESEPGKGTTMRVIVPIEPRNGATA